MPFSEALSHAAYGGTLEHAGGHPPTPDPDWRRDLLPLLPNRDVPILLVDVGGRGEFADYGTSSVNKREQKVVLELVERLRNILDDRVSIAVLSPYLGQKNEMKHLLEGSSANPRNFPFTHLDYHCFVRTVDSFVGQVAGKVGHPLHLVPDPRVRVQLYGGIRGARTRPFKYGLFGHLGIKI